MFSNDLKLIEIAVIISGIVIFRKVKSLRKYKKNNEDGFMDTAIKYSYIFFPW